jgi:hypothetical protein
VQPQPFKRGIGNQQIKQVLRGIAELRIENQEKIRLFMSK